ncbi:hypothetical protein ASD03_36015 [Ensifer sp. Root127]|jgi:hypothetical protein|nr:hypothetical protein ASD03_36015 [Ensifer sp. Root127]
MNVQAFRADLLLSASMEPLSVGLPGREKSSMTLLAWAQRSRSREIDVVVDLVVTTPTGTNVNDFRAILIV